MRTSESQALICIIDDDADARKSLDSLLRSAGFAVRTFEAPSQFLACDAASRAACLVLDVRLGDVDGLDFQESLIASQMSVPVILVTGYADIAMTVRGMKAGAVNFLPKPFDHDNMLTSVAEAVERDRLRREQWQRRDGLSNCYATLTRRERQVMALVTAGLRNKQVAGKLGLRETTIKIHRGNLMRKMRARSLPALVRMAETLGVVADDLVPRCSGAD